MAFEQPYKTKVVKPEPTSGGLGKLVVGLGLVWLASRFISSK